MKLKQWACFLRLSVVVGGLVLGAGSKAWGADAEMRKVVIVTGIDYPGHKWKETAPALAGELRKDPRLQVDVVDKPDFLALEKLRDYAVVVLHFMNWETPDPGAQARQNLAQFVRDGGGVVAVHFACGAFQGWPEFEKIVGRVYDPKLRGHDPYGSFQVTMTDADHPITRGLKSFEIKDELYTCLAGQLPIQVLAESKSKVDGKNYAMAFVLSYGKGRVFHSPLGHDVGAFTNPGAAELFRRGCAWAAGLAPVATTKGKKVAFLAGKPSHGAGSHDWDQVARFVKQCLQQATNIEPPQVDVYDNAWPANPAALDDVDAIVFFADGREMHPLIEPGRLAKVRELVKRGTGIMFLHYSIDPPAGAQPDLTAWMGGCYEAGYSQNPVNVVKVTPARNGHPITRGCSGYVAEDEWYFDIRFRANDTNVVPIMTGKLPPRDPQDKILAWAYTRPDGGRGFGFAGGHYTANWHMEPFRKLVLNAILWVAQAEVPKDGVSSTPTWRFVSIPNFPGADLAYPQPGWEDTLDYVLKAIKAENPEFVLVPGDLVEGRWPDKAAVEKLAAAQYAAWVKRMEDHGLRFYAAVGDHELGGRPWPDDKAALVPLFKRQFQRYLNMPRNGPLRLKGMAYSFVHENTLFLALDVFERGSDAQAGIVTQVTGEQLQWLEQTLADNPGVRHVVVMGHTPVLGPAGSASSGSLMLAGGRQSSLWQALKKHGVDLYLCAETRALAGMQTDGILQVAHGSEFGRDANVNYLVATVYPDRIDLELKQIAILREGGLLSPAGGSGPSEKIRIADDVRQKGFTTVGAAVLHRDRTGLVLSNATGVFEKASLP